MRGEKEKKIENSGEFRKWANLRGALRVQTYLSMQNIKLVVVGGIGFSSLLSLFFICLLIKKYVFSYACRRCNWQDGS